MNAGGETLDFLIREASIILSKNPGEISGDTPLASLGFDSMSFVELLISIEKKYQIKLIEIGVKPDDMKTLEALARRLQSAL